MKNHSWRERSRSARIDGLCATSRALHITNVTLPSNDGLHLITDRASGLRVIVQTGSYELDNIGDRAMVEVLIDRIRARYPEARMLVFARDAQRVALLGKSIDQIPVEQKREWALVRAAHLWTRRVFPVADSLLRRAPWLYNAMLRSKARALVNSDALSNADLMVISGGGFIADVFAGQAWSVLERMSAAIENDIPFALLGQGIGPLRDKALLRRARDVFPFAKLIAVRETLYSVPLLIDLGVSAERIVFTGDDAIEPAFKARTGATGTSIGVNFRVAPYSGITAKEVSRLGALLRALAADLETSLAGLPVCTDKSVESASDADIVSLILGERLTIDTPVPANPAELTQRIAECRIVVTGSYHAAVLALAQGIPAVCVFKSEYYGNKFRGLAEAFGEGCRVVDGADSHFDEVLTSEIRDLWINALELRELLTAAAGRQVSAGHEAYAKLFSIVDALRGVAGLGIQGPVA